MPTQVWRNTAEGYSTDGTNVTAGSGGNSGAGSGDFITAITLNSGTMQAKTAAAAHGSFGYRLTRSGTNQTYFHAVFASDISDFVGQHYQSIPTQPSADHVLFKGYSDAAFTTTSWAVVITTTGKLKVLAGTASTSVYVSTATLPPATRTRFEYEIVSGTSIRVVAFSGDSTTVLADSGVITSGATVVGVTRMMRIGLLTATTAPTYIDYDDMRFGSGPGLFGLTTTALPAETVSNAGAWVPDGGATLHAVLSDANAATAAESVSGGSAVAFRVGFGDQVIPEGSISVSYDAELDIASPSWTVTCTAYLGGVSKGSQTQTISSTTSSPHTFTVSGLAGDMTTLEIGFVASSL